MARRNSARGMHKTVRLLATGLAALILCGGMVLLFVQKERAAANAAGEPTAEPIAPTPAPRFTVVIDPATVSRTAERPAWIRALRRKG